MDSFTKVSEAQFDRILEAHRVHDEHDFLESRFFDRSGRVIAKVIRYLDDDDELLPVADLLVASDLVGND